MSTKFGGGTANGRQARTVTPTTVRCVSPTFQTRRQFVSCQHSPDQYCWFAHQAYGRIESGFNVKVSHRIRKALCHGKVLDEMSCYGKCRWGRHFLHTAYIANLPSEPQGFARANRLSHRWWFRLMPPSVKFHYAALTETAVYSGFL
jgi:hypothetical protein